MMIVDDEDWVRERLIRTLDWESKEVRVVDEAGNGTEALEKALRIRPEIILTDIRMPNMDGLEFIRRLKENRIEAKTIIISGYSDFDYAKKAIALGAFDYILKPVEDHDLFSVVERCIEQIRAERTQIALLQKADHQVNKRLPLLKEMLFSSLIHHPVPNEREIHEAFMDFGIENENLKHVCFLIQVNEDVTPGAPREDSGDFVSFVIQNVARDVVNAVSVNEILFANAGEVVGIVSSRLPSDRLSERLLALSEDIRKVIGRILNCTVAIGIGGECDNLVHIGLSYRQAKQSALADGYLSKKSGNGRSLTTNAWKAAAYRGYDTNPLVNAMVTGNKQAALAGLDRIMHDHPMLQPAELKFVYITIVNAIARTSLIGNQAVEDFSNYCLQLLEVLNQSHQVEEIRGLMAGAIEKIMDHLEKTQSKRRRKVIEKATSYIEENYCRPISLGTVSDMLMLNASYLSKIFKEEMGIPFSKYLMEYRVSKAIQLMRDPTLKMYEISSLVGYEDVQYFTKVFKAIKGIAPMQYREKIN
ncbi:response regulator [Cohnella caldifontis]|uniref:response regulator n=1 Tax=Cohnella caldifontis TaxID=3027471 RepID=UPI0023EB7216|nr:response regulator [Cohnella sp. YIM B05605]